MSINSYLRKKEILRIHKKAQRLAVIGLIIMITGLLGIGDYPAYETIEMEIPPLFVAISVIGGLIAFYTCIRYGKYLDLSNFKEFNKEGE